MLRITWVASRADFPQSIRVVRDLAERLALRGHACTIAYALPRRKSIPVPRLLAPVVARRAAPPAALHQLATASVDSIVVCGPRILARHVPDADVVIGTGAQSMQWIEPWPGVKGAPAHLVQWHEIAASDSRQLAAMYRRPILKLTISSELRDLMSDHGDPRAVWIPSAAALEEALTAYVDDPDRYAASVDHSESWTLASH